MPTSYTSLLGLALPVTGELSGTWGDTVNDYITTYLDAAIAGAQVISGSQTAVTLSTTNGGALSQAGSGATGSSQYQIINCTGNPASLLTVTAPAASKVYLVINSTSTSQSVKIVGAGPTTGVTVASNTAALVAWNGSDFRLIATSSAVTPSSSDTLTNKTISVDSNTISGIAASSFVLSNGSGNIDGAAAQKVVPSGAVVGTTDVQTLTDKRVTPRSVEIASSATITPTSDTADQYEVTALAVPATVAAPSGTPTDGQRLILRFKDDGTGRALTWTTGSSGSYRAVGVTLPTTTVASKTTYVGCIYNVADSRWDVVAVTTEA